MQWVDPAHIVVALNSKLGLIRLSPEKNVEELGMKIVRDMD